MELTRLLGFVGDAVTFISGILLSWDAIRSETEFIEATTIMEGMKHPVMKGVKVKLDKMIVTNDQGVERVFRRRASKKAIGGRFSAPIWVPHIRALQNRDKLTQLSY
jgi:hypothetical protein